MTAADWDAERIRECARNIVTDRVLVVDPESHSWQVSLTLILNGVDLTNVGAILVPVAPHMGGRWLNGTVPGVTLEAILVPREAIPDLSSEVLRMTEALA